MQRAAVWTGLNSFVLRFAQFAVGVIVARLIAPEEFGVFAVALVVYAVIANVSDLGVSAAIVRTDRDLDDVAPTIFSIALLSSGALTAAMWLSAPALASALGAAEATSAIRILSLNIVVGGLTSVPYGILIKTFRQDLRFIADVANFAVSTVLVIVLAAKGYGADGLAWSKLAGIVVSWVLLLVLITPRYRPGWRRGEAWPVLAYCLPLAGASIIAFALTNVDSIVVGRVLGPLALGFYALAFNIAGWPVSVFGQMVNEVALPAFAHVRRDWSRFPERLAAVFALAAAVAMPVSVLCLGLADSIVRCVYGAKWHLAAPVLAVLGGYGAMRVLMTVLTIYLTAVGASRSVLGIQLTWIVVLVPALYVGVEWKGIVGAGLVQPIVVLAVVFPVAAMRVRKHGGGSVWGLIRACVRPFGGVALIACWLVALHQFTDPGWGQLLIGGFGSLALYLASTGRWLRSQLFRVRHLWDEDQAAPPALAVDAS